MTPLAHIAATIGAVTTIGGASAYIAEPHVTEYLAERYATVEQVAANAESIALNRIENALQSGNQALLRRLCDDFSRLHGYRPSACR